MKQNKAREYLIEQYLTALQENKIPWIKPWNSTRNGSPLNPKTKKRYHGVNYLILNYIAELKGYDDHRWCTFNQAKDKGWSIKEGEKGTPIEYWAIFDKKEKKNISFDEYERRSKEERDNFDEERYSLVSRVSYVFNGTQIKGIPPLPKKEDNISLKDYSNDFVDEVIKEMKVSFECRGNSAFYSPNEDIVVLPNSEKFKSEYNYNATALHELCHATGHKNRLNRDLSGRFGTSNYAKEELRAEISSSFLMADLELSFSEEHIENHKAYIQSWIEILKDEPNELFKAIRDAEVIADYVAEKGNLEYFKEMNQCIQKNIENLYEDGLLDDDQLDSLYKNINQVKDYIENVEIYSINNEQWHEIFADILHKSKELER